MYMNKRNKSEVLIKAQTLVSTSLSESLPDVEDSTSFDFGILLRQGIKYQTDQIYIHIHRDRFILDFLKLGPAAYCKMISHYKCNP